MMQPTLCSRCHKNVAVIFVTRIDGSETKNEGLCLKCAKELGLKGLDSSRPYYMTFIMAPEVDERAFYTVVANEAEALADPMELIYPGEVPTFEKYDELVPELLVRKGFAEGTLDVAGMKARVAQWV